MNIQKLLTPKTRQQPSTDTNPHELRAFFRGRRISQKAICDFLKIKGLNQSVLSQYLSGVKTGFAIQDKVERGLREIEAAILESEKN